LKEQKITRLKKILNHRKVHNGRQFLVQWLGEDDEWIHEGYIKAKELIEKASQSRMWTIVDQ